MAGHSQHMDSLVDRLRSQSSSVLQNASPPVSQARQSPSHQTPFNYHAMGPSQHQDVTSPGSQLQHPQHYGQQQYPPQPVNQYFYPGPQYMQSQGPLLQSGPGYTGASPIESQSQRPGLGFTGANSSDPHPRRTPSNSAQTTNLLGLLKFAGPSVPLNNGASPAGNKVSSEPTNGFGIGPRSESRQSGFTGRDATPQTAQDLVASLLDKATSPTTYGPPGRSSLTPQSSFSPPPQQNADALQTDLLHEVLGRSKPAQAESTAVPDTTHDGANDDVPASHLASGGDVSKPFAAGSAKTIFTYVNPFEQLHATSPRNKIPNPKPAAQASSLGPGFVPASGISPVATPSNIPLPFSPPPPLEPVNLLGNFHDVRHTPPITLPYVEDINDPFGDENDLLESETDPFDETDGLGATEAPETAEPLPSTTIESTTVLIEKVLETTFAKVEEIPEPVQTEPAANGNDAAPPVRVYNFPMKPFTQITVNAISDPPTFAEAKYNDIARMSRTVDQLDRNLISASAKFIVYSLNKSRNGVRVIRQEDGKDIVLAKDSTDKMVHVQVGSDDRVMATGNSGAVLWAHLEPISFEDTQPTKTHFTFPPSDEQDQNNGLTKSRAHKSSCHTDIFAIGRGRFINVINASIANKYLQQGNDKSEVDEKTYLANHGRTIDTGKVSKDFCFSEDDTAILSVDKAGKLKLWDVRNLLRYDVDGIDQSATLEPITEPLATFTAVPSGETYKATSVMFLDKARPSRKQFALRYALVGLKQNHVLQLWDLAIGKPVQEVRFPQESQTDALCSVVYHPPTGIIAIGNPTRNTISFIHLSSPRYNLPNISQTDYARAINEKSPILPKIDATAIMSGLREYSFGSKGQLISMDILDAVASPSSDEGSTETEDLALFELYVAHSKGMTCLTIRKEDLGWDKDSKAKLVLDAIKEGICTTLPLPAAPEESPKEEPLAPLKKEQPLKETPRTILRSDAKPAAAAATSIRKRSPTRPVVANEEEATEKLDDASSSEARKAPRNKKAKREGGNVALPSPTKPVANTSAANSIVLTPSTPSTSTDVPPPATALPAKKKDKSKDKEKARDDSKLSLGVNQEMLELGVKKFESTVSAEVSKVSMDVSKLIKDEMATLYQKLDADKRVQQAHESAKQEAVLRLLSSTLVAGMETVLTDIMAKSVSSQVMPEINNAIAKNLQTVLPQAVAAPLPEIVRKVLTSREMMSNVTKTVTEQVDKSVRSTLIPALDKLSADTVKFISSEVSKRSRESLKEAKKVHDSDALKISQLTGAVSDLTSAFAMMEKTVLSLLDQSKVLTTLLEQTLTSNAQHQARGGNGSQPASESPEPEEPMTEEEMQIQSVERFLRQDDYDEALLTWLRIPSLAGQNHVLEKSIFSLKPAEIVPRLSLMVVLTVAASVTSDLDHFLDKRLEWLGAALDDLVLNQEDDQLREVLPKILSVIVSRLSQYYMAISEETPSAPILKVMSRLTKQAKQLTNSVIAAGDRAQMHHGQ